MNTLYPVFLKPENLSFLIIGGGNVGLEKVTNLFRSSPNAKVRLISKEVLPEIYTFAEDFEIEIIRDSFHEKYIRLGEIVIVATDNRLLNINIHRKVKKIGCIVNVADMPDFCDFYMGSIVVKGDLKIAISTNGKSPTLAKRMREWLTDLLPDEIDVLVQNLHTYRNTLFRDSFEEKVQKLNKLTQSFF